MSRQTFDLFSVRQFLMEQEISSFTTRIPLTVI
jgi:hypothetical protein